MRHYLIKNSRRNGFTVILYIDKQKKHSQFMLKEKKETSFLKQSYNFPKKISAEPNRDGFAITF
jgi:hypothetical protein